MKKVVVACLTVFMVTGCASGINKKQKLDYETYKARGLAQEEKSPAAGAAFGLLPGGGSFYGREYGLGVVNLLFWPLSILWDPVSGVNASERINYITTKQYVEQERTREINQLNQNRMTGIVDDQTYRFELARISQKYDIDVIQAPQVQYTPVQPKNKSQNKQQQIDALQQQNLPYVEYQRRYNEIMGQ